MTISLAAKMRSIPAHAGEPGAMEKANDNDRVYPRARGGAFRDTFLDLRAKGLSPHTRGSRGLPTSSPSYQRSIPAHAGEP